MPELYLEYWCTAGGRGRFFFFWGGVDAFVVEQNIGTCCEEGDFFTRHEILFFYVTFS